MDSASQSADNTLAADAGQLAGFLRRHRRIAVLTGAGVSTASGIPDYRDAEGQWKHARPVMYADFRGSARVRQRYWARSLVGWEYFRRAVPNVAHAALAALERCDLFEGLITQNVDRLHQQAGHQRVVDLHGRLDQVVCLDCGEVTTREAMQLRLQAANPDFTGTSTGQRPDGDAEVDTRTIESFSVPACLSCGGVLKPDVVFFGQAVPRDWVSEATQTVERADALLIVGSSLMVFSGYRFARQAAARRMPLAIVGLGRTRADELATLRLRGDCGALLSQAHATMT
ncbi:MAG: NAD-dependent protein deacetylase [Gammaproteobacteria bacterium]|nr:NAD-dependent protein deacetylase [Gammaproteobacteria bacterium]